MLNILALVYRDQNKYKEAANLLHDALQVRWHFPSSSLDQVDYSYPNLDPNPNLATPSTPPNLLCHPSTGSYNLL